MIQVKKKQMVNYVGKKKQIGNHVGKKKANRQINNYL